MSAGPPTSRLTSSLDDTINSNYSSSNGLVGSPVGGPYFGRRNESSRSLDSLIAPGAQLSGSAAAMYLTKCKHRGMQPIPAYYQRLLLFDTSNRKSLDFSDMHPFGVEVVDGAALLADSFHIVLDILVVSPDVRRVDLSNAGVNDEWAEHVAHTTLKCPGITTIDLSRNPLLTDSAGAVLMAMLKTRAGIGLKLKHVSLQGSSMSPSMAKALASAGAACGSEVVVEGSTLQIAVDKKGASGDGGLNSSMAMDDSDAASTHGIATPTFLTVPKRGRSWSCADVEALASDGPLTPATPSKSELSPAAVALVYRGRHVVRCLFGLFHRSLCVLCWEPPIRTLMWFILLLSWLLSGLTVGTASVAVAVLLTHTTNVHQHHHDPSHPPPSDKQPVGGGAAPQENPLLSLLTGLYHVVFQHTFQRGNTIDAVPPTLVGTQATATVLALIPASNQLYRWKVLLEEQVLLPLNATDDPHRVLEALHEAFTILEMLIVGVSLSGSAIPPSTSQSTTAELVSGGGRGGGSHVQLSKKGSFVGYLRRHRRTLMLAMMVCLFVVVPLESVLSLVVVGLFLWVPVWSPLISIIKHSSEGKASLLGHWLLSLDTKVASSTDSNTHLQLRDATKGTSPTFAPSTTNGDIQSNLLPLSFMFLHQSSEDAVVRMLSMLGGDAPLLSMTVLPATGGNGESSTVAPQSQSKAVAKLNLARVVEDRSRRVVGSTVARGGLIVPLQYATTPLVVTSTSTKSPLRLDISVFVSTTSTNVATRAVLEGTVDFTIPIGNDPIRIEVPLYYLALRKEPPLPPTDQESSPTTAAQRTRTSDRFLQRRRSSTLVSSLVGEVEKQEKRDRDRYSFALNHEHRPTAVATTISDAFSQQQQQPPAPSHIQREVIATLEVEIWRTGHVGVVVDAPQRNPIDEGESSHLPHLAVRAPSISVSSPGDETDPFSDSSRPQHHPKADSTNDNGREEGPCFTSSGNGSVPRPQPHHHRRMVPTPLNAKAITKGGDMKDSHLNTTPVPMTTSAATPAASSRASGRKGAVVTASTGKRSARVGRRLKL